METNSTVPGPIVSRRIAVLRTWRSKIHSGTRSPGPIWLVLADRGTTLAGQWQSALNKEASSTEYGVCSETHPLILERWKRHGRFRVSNRTVLYRAAHPAEAETAWPEESISLALPRLTGCYFLGARLALTSSFIHTRTRTCCSECVDCVAGAPYWGASERSYSYRVRSLMWFA